MSGHITRMSRGSSVRVVLEQPDQHLAEHVDLARRAVAGVHLEAAVGRRRGDGRRARRRSARGWRAGRAAAARAAWSARPSAERRVASRLGEAGARRATRRSSRASRPERGEQRVADALGRRVVVAGDDAAEVGEARPTARARPAGGTGGRRGARPSAASSSTSVTGSRVWPNSDSRGGRSRPSPPARSAVERRGVTDVGRVGAPTRVSTRRQSSGCQAEVGVERSPGAVGVAALAPVGDERAAAGRRTTRTARPAGCATL